MYTSNPNFYFLNYHDQGINRRFNLHGDVVGVIDVVLGQLNEIYRALGTFK
jgi:hypothetical protein